MIGPKLAAPFQFETRDLEDVSWCHGDKYDCKAGSHTQLNILPITIFISANSALYQSQLQLVLTLFPVRHHFFQQSVEGGAVVVMLKMTKFMGNHVIDTLARCLDKRYVQSERAAFR